MKALKGIVITLLVILAALLIFSSVTYVVNQGEYAVVKQFGKVVQIESEPGLKFKVPVIQSVETLPNKELIHDLPISEVITKDKQTMVADCFALWRITDPQKFISSLNGSMPNATSRIEVLVYNAMKNEMSSRTQAEIISDRTGKLASDITEVAKPNFSQYGIELIAVETKHLDLPFDNKESVYNRMISERANISAGHTAEGEKEAKMIKSETDKQVAIMIAEARAQAEQLMAEGEAEYMKILSDAYNDPSKAEFYEFVRALDAAKASLSNGENVLVLDKDSPLVDVFYMNPAN
ncbi:MAG: protease modulator HflC [Agathobacter sp.]|nr:protease modulator HflC [Agathobacter sp.]